MRLPKTAHTSQPWRIHEIVPDFRLEDVWGLPAAGRADEFGLLVEGIAAADPMQIPSRTVRGLWSLRLKLGELFGLEDAGAGVESLRERLPDDLRAAAGPEVGSLPFTSLYLTEDEFAGEIVNRTVHGVMHLGWVAEGDGSYRGQMAVYVKPNGAFGSVYMEAIKPARHLIVYPAMMRELDRRWQER